ncbi:MAG: hypothetical protein H6983_03200 [Ectothiorhodospiraceae bacterium]|nr:hypothetical protein [Ectothiorhodospiraceae bacterium]
MDWDRFLKRYVWDDETTPYLVPVARLTRRQADYELYAYAIFLGTLFAVVSVAALTGKLPGGRLPGVAFYAFAMVCAAVLLGFGRSHLAALYTATGPVAALAYFYLFGFHPKLSGIDHVAIVLFVVLWLRYSVRVIAIARRYGEMPEGEGKPRGRRGRWHD